MPFFWYVSRDEIERGNECFSFDARPIDEQVKGRVMDSDRHGHLLSSRYRLAQQPNQVTPKKAMRLLFYIYKPAQNGARIQMQ